jgi:hypothetical protein
MNIKTATLKLHEESSENRSRPYVHWEWLRAGYQIMEGDRVRETLHGYCRTNLLFRRGSLILGSLYGSGQAGSSRIGLLDSGHLAQGISVDRTMAPFCVREWIRQSAAFREGVALGRT